MPKPNHLSLEGFGDLDPVVFSVFELSFFEEASFEEASFLELGGSPPLGLRA